MARTNIIDYDDETGINADLAKVEVVDSKVTQKDQRPSGAILHHNFKQLQECWKNENFDLSMRGGATLGEGEATFPVDTISYVETEASGLAGLSSRGSIMVRLMPGFTGNPSRNIRIFRVTNPNDLSNLIDLIMDTSSNIRVSLKDSYGDDVAVSETVYSFQFQENRVHEFKWCFDTTLGYHKLFIDGVPSPISLPYVYTRNSSVADILQIGSNIVPQPASMVVNSILISTSIDTGAYEALKDISETIYSKGYVAVTDSPGVITDNIQSSDIVYEGDVRVYINVGIVKRYYNGAEWVESDGTELQSNTPQEMMDNITTLLNGGALVTYTVLLGSDGFTKSSVSKITTIYAFEFIPNIPSKCMVYGAIIDAKGMPVIGATVSIKGEDYQDSEILIKNSCDAKTDSYGKFELELIETETSNKKVDILIFYKKAVGKADRKIEQVTIPNLPTCSIADLY